jgi:ABC-type multidrug transport system permease subunit
MDQFLKLVSLLAYLVVIAACVCRVDKMRASYHSWYWFLVYALFSAYALGMLISIWHGTPMGFADAACVGGLLLYMVLTRSRWSDGPPPETAKRTHHATHI